MCGIAGIVAKNSKKYERNIKKMISEFVYRGPDGEGTEFFDGCALGHRRLSIIDLKSGEQPMFSFDKQKAIVFNGEIYGYQEIKKTLSDYKFQTNSDTEVILALYNEYGKEFIEHLPGMFAFALWDDKEKELVCARDRFGEKPLYYAFGENGEFVFASEIKAILASGFVKPKLNKSALAYYLKRLYINPQETIYENIHTLPPAHKLIYQKGKLSVSRYWRIPDLNYSINIDEAIQEFKKLLNQAVERQLIADVPVGAFLSGGLDSSTIVAIASKYKKNLNTFSFAFRDSVNELPYAREIAKKYNTNHTELFDDEEDLGELLIKIQDVYDEPFGDSSNIPTYLLSKLARKYTKVILTGDGGDEMFGGYGWYKPFLHINKNNVLLRSYFMRFLAKAITKIPFNFENKNLLYEKSLGAFYAKNFPSLVFAHLSQNLVFNDKNLIELGFKKEHLLENYSLSRQKNTLDDVNLFDIENYMSGDILVKIDRASMANGLELRAPFLDVDFASFCISLPYKFKITKDDDKYILRKAVSSLWTDSVRKRRKQGFGAPIQKWLKEPSFIALKNDYLRNGRRKIFNILPFSEIQNFTKKDNYKTWVLLVLSIWMEKHDFNL